MLTLARTDRSPFGRWWWTVDRWQLAAMAGLAGFGALLAPAASPAAAGRLGLDPGHFALRHLVFLILALALGTGVSFLTPARIRRLCALGLAVSLGLLAVTLLLGHEINGARRWLIVGGFSLQASEFVKPTLVVVLASLLSRRRPAVGVWWRPWPGVAIGMALFALVAGLLVAQPDIGQTLILAAVWTAQLFLAGLSLWLIGGLIVLAIAGLGLAYHTLPHVNRRIDGFLHPDSSYQTGKSIEAFVNGGWFGRGPGEGWIKNALPDAHADFIFAVAGEELGVLLALVILGLFGFLVLRGFARAMRDGDLFVLLATAGLVTLFGLQALVNMGSALGLIPPKGTTLPLISYGGSSLLAVGLVLGMILGLTRRRFPGDGP